MDSENVNRVSLAALGSILFAMLLVAFSNLVISPKTPAVPGFALPTSGGEFRSCRRSRCAALGAACRRCSPRPTRRRANNTPRSARPVTISRRARVRKSGRRYGASPGGPIASVPGFSYSEFAERDRRKLDLGSAQYDGQQSENGGVRHQDGVPGRKGPAAASRHPGLSPDPFGLADPVPKVSATASQRKSRQSVNLPFERRPDQA